MQASSIILLASHLYTPDHDIMINIILIIIDSNIVVIIGGSLGSCFGIVLCCAALVTIIAIARLKGGTYFDLYYIMIVSICINIIDVT